MKNSLFKRVAATAVALPLALTQCLTVASAAEADDAAFATLAAPMVGTAANNNSYTLEKLLRIEPDKTISNWNESIFGFVYAAGAMGVKGNVNPSQFANVIYKNAKGYSDAAKAFLEKCVFVNPMTYEVNDNNDIVIKASVSQPNFNAYIKNTPGEALNKIADAYNAPALKNVDYSAVKVAVDVTVTIETSKLGEGSTTVPVKAEFKTEEGTFGIDGMIDYVRTKLTAVKDAAHAAIKAEVVGAYTDEAIAKYDAEVNKYFTKINAAENALNTALTKTTEFTSVSAALTSANNFLTKKNIKKQIPTSGAGLAGSSMVAKYAAKAVNTANKKLAATGLDYTLDISAEQVGAFIDSLTSKSNDAAATDFKISVNNGVATLVGAFDDAEKDEVAAWVESQGFAYVDSYKKLTGVVDFTGAKDAAASNATVDVQIERILVTDTTTTTTSTTTSSEKTTTTTVSGVSTSSSTETVSTSSSTETVSTSSSTETVSTSSSTETASTSSSTETVSTSSSTETVSTSSSTETVSTSSSTETVSTSSSTETVSTSSSTETVSTSSSTETVSTSSSTETVSTSSSTETVSTSSSTETVSTSSSTETVSTSSSTETVSTSSSTETVSTSSSTESSSTESSTTESSTTTSSTTTETTPGKTTGMSVAVKSVYVEADTNYAFYLNTDKEFNKSQVKSATLHVVYEKKTWEEDVTGSILNEETTSYEETKDISGSVGFATTPAAAFTKENDTFLYNITLTYTGETINDADGKAIITTGDSLKVKDGTAATAPAYIGMKGDASLDNIIDARDASAVLAFYATTSTAGHEAKDVILTTNPKVTTPTDVLDEFAAFLCDVKVSESEASRNYKAVRTIDARDASAILTYYANSSTSEYSQMSIDEPDKLWNITLGIAVEEG